MNQKTQDAVSALENLREEAKFHQRELRGSCDIVSQHRAVLGNLREQLNDLREARERSENELRYEQEALRSAKEPTTFITAGDAKARDEQFRVLLARMADSKNKAYDTEYGKLCVAEKELERKVNNEQLNLQQEEIHYDSLVMVAKIEMKRIEAQTQILQSLTIAEQLSKGAL